MYVYYLLQYVSSCLKYASYFSEFRKIRKCELLFIYSQDEYIYNNNVP